MSGDYPPPVSFRFYLERSLSIHDEEALVISSREITGTKIGPIDRRKNYDA